jgi:hypothetical protein
VPSIDDLFKGRHFDQEIIILCVRWYLRFKLSFRDLVEMMAERRISLAQNPSDAREGEQRPGFVEGKPICDLGPTIGPLAERRRRHEATKPPFLASLLAGPG